MRLDQLIYLVEIARCRSMSQAASSLGLTPQALSLSVQGLEKKLGVQLLRRDNQGCVLTNDGERVLVFARDCLSAYKHLQADLHPGCSPLSGTLQVYVTSMFYFVFHPDVMQRFCASHPLINVAFAELSQEEIYARLMSPPEEGVHRVGIVHVAFPLDQNNAHFIPPDQNMDLHIFATGQYIACVSRHSPLARHRELSLKTLLRHPVVMGSGDGSILTPLHHQLSRHGHPHFVFSATTLGLWSQMIAQNVGIGFLNEIFLHGKSGTQDYLGNLALIKIRERIAAGVGYVLPALPTPEEKAFVEFLPQVLQSVHSIS